MTDTVRQEELAQELARVNQQLDQLKQEHAVVRKAALLLGSSIKRLARQEQERFGID